MLVSAGVLSVGALGAGIVMPMAAHAAPSPIVVTPADTQGWATQDGAPTYVNGPAGADGSGSLEFATDNTSTSKENYFHATNTPLSDATGMGYKVDVAAGVPASYQLQVTGVDRLDSTSSTFTSLVWEPTYNGQPNGPNNGFVTESNLANGTWWSTHPIAGDPAGNNGFVPLSQIIAANPNATVTAFGINVGSGTPNATSYVDDVSFMADTYNFEPVAPDTTAPTVAITNPTDGSTVSGTVAIRGTVTDENLDHYFLKISNESGQKIYGNTVYTDQSFTDQSLYQWDTTQVPDGNYTIDLEARDQAGNKTSASVDQVTVTVNNTVDNADQCKDNGWMSFTKPAFKNQGQCVAYANHHDGNGQDDVHATMPGTRENQ